MISTMYFNLCAVAGCESDKGCCGFIHPDNALSKANGVVPDAIANYYKAVIQGG